MGANKNMKQVNIIIPIHNRWEHTKQTLESLLLNTDPALCKISLIDDDSTKENREAIFNFQREYSGPHRWEIFFNDQNIGPAASRNRMSKSLVYRGEKLKYIYHSDNDVYFKKGWLETLIKAYEELDLFDVKLLGGGCHAYQQNNEVIKLSDNLQVGIKNAVSGYSQFMSWIIWEKFGPFDEGSRGLEEKIAGSEDWAFCQKLIEAGLKVGSIEPEVVIHTGRTNTYGKPATGSETIVDQEGVMVK